MPTPRASISPAIVAGARASSASPTRRSITRSSATSAAPRPISASAKRRLARARGPEQQHPAGADRHRRGVKCQRFVRLGHRTAAPFPSARRERNRTSIQTGCDIRRPNSTNLHFPLTYPANETAGSRVIQHGGRVLRRGNRPAARQFTDRLEEGTGEAMNTVFKVQERVNPRMTLEATGFPGVAKVHYNLLEPALVQAAVARGEGDLGIGGALLVATGRHTGRSPKDKFVVREPSVVPHVWWENNAPMATEHFCRLLRRHARPHPGRRALRAGSLRRRRPRAPAERPRHHRARLARPLHPPHAAPPRPGRAARLHARLHHPQLPELPRRPGPPRLPLRDRDRDLLRAAADPDRRHRLRRREQEERLQRPQLPAAREGRDADALLGQPRPPATRTTSRCSSACRAPARPRSRPIPSAC